MTYVALLIIPAALNGACWVWFTGLGKRPWWQQVALSVAALALFFALAFALLYFPAVLAWVAAILVITWWGIGQVRHWSLRKRIGLIIGSIEISCAILVLGFAVGIVGAIQGHAMQWKIDALERGIYKGETRFALEAQFGKSIPMPDVRDSGIVGPMMTTREIEAVKNTYRYLYFSGSALCVTTFHGFQIKTDAQGRIRSWKPAQDGSGC